MPREVKDYFYTINFHPCIDPDGMSYPVVEIGEQSWMAKNLAYLPAVNTPIANQNVDFKAYYVNEYMGGNVEEAKATENYSKYGVLYNWNAAETVCPNGWHLPEDAEWKELESYLGMPDN